MAILNFKQPKLSAQNKLDLQHAAIQKVTERMARIATGNTDLRESEAAHEAATAKLNVLEGTLAGDLVSQKLGQAISASIEQTRAKILKAKADLASAAESLSTARSVPQHFTQQLDGLRSERKALQQQLPSLITDVFDELLTEFAPALIAGEAQYAALYRRARSLLLARELHRAALIAASRAGAYSEPIPPSLPLLPALEMQVPSTAPTRSPTAIPRQPSAWLQARANCSRLCCT